MSYRTPLSTSRHQNPNMIDHQKSNLISLTFLTCIRIFQGFLNLLRPSEQKMPSKQILVFEKNRTEFLLYGRECFGRSFSMLKRKFPLVDIKKFNH